MGDESAMNLEGLGLSFSRNLLFSAAFLRVRSEPRRERGPNKLHRARPIGVAYGGAIIHPRYYRFLMYIGLRTSELYIRSPAA
jgi:hypothetical protein